MNAWYESLTKPSWQPPDWLFGPVWTVLYMMMAVAFFLFARRSRGRLRAVGLGVYAVNILANALWSPLFFRWHLVGWALIDCVIIAATAWFLIVWYWRSVRTGALLLLPYAAWSSFACVLNGQIWLLNR
jgi:tryptophan-rich sensory protein